MELWDDEKGEWTSYSMEADYRELIDGEEDPYEPTAVVHPFSHRQFRAVAEKLVIPPMVLDLMLKDKDCDYSDDATSTRPRSTWKLTSASARRPNESSRDRERAADRNRSKNIKTTWTGKMGGVRDHSPSAPTAATRPSRSRSRGRGTAASGRGTCTDRIPVRMGGATSGLRPRVSGRGRALKMRAEKGGALLRKPGQPPLKSFPKSQPQQQQQQTTASVVANDEPSRNWSLKPSKSLAPQQQPPSSAQATGYSGAELQLQSDWPELNSDPKPRKATPNWKLPNPVKSVISSPRRNSKSKSPSHRATNVRKSNTTSVVGGAVTKSSDSPTTDSTLPLHVSSLPEANNYNHTLQSSTDTEVPSTTANKGGDAPLITCTGTSTVAAASKSRPRKQQPARPRSRGTRDPHYHHHRQSRRTPRNFRAFYNSAESSDDIIVVHSSSDPSEFDFDDEQRHHHHHRRPHGYRHDRDEAENKQLLANLEKTTTCHTEDQEGGTHIDTCTLSISNQSLSSLASAHTSPGDNGEAGTGGVFSMSHPPQTNGLLSVANLTTECLVNELNIDSHSEAIVIACEENPFVSREENPVVSGEEDPVIVTEIREEEKQQEEERGLKVEPAQILETPSETRAEEGEETPVISSETTSKNQALENDFTNVTLATENAPLINETCSKPVTELDKNADDDIHVQVGEPVEAESVSLASGEDPVISEENVHGNREEPLETNGLSAGGEDPLISEKIQGSGGEEPESPSLGDGEDPLINEKIQGNGGEEPESPSLGGGEDPLINGNGEEPKTPGGEDPLISSGDEVKPISSIVGGGGSGTELAAISGAEGGGEDPLISGGDEVEPVSSVVGGGGGSGMELAAISGAEVNSEMEAKVADSLSVSKEGNGACTCRDGEEEDVPLISDGTTNSHMYCLDDNGGSRRIDQSDLNSIDEDVLDIRSSGAKKYCPSPSLLPTDEDAPLIFFSDEIECSHIIHPCPLLPENLPSPLVSEWDAPLNSTANESFDNLPSPLLSTAGEISLTFVTDESFMNHQSPLPPKEGDAPTISTTDEGSKNIQCVEGGVPQISSIQGGAFASPIFAIEGKNLANSSSGAPSTSSIEVNFDETSLPIFQLEDSESDYDQETTEACTETTSLDSMSEDDRGQRSISPHGNGRCYSVTSTPPNEQVSASIQLLVVDSLTTGALDAATPCSVETEGGLPSTCSDCCDSCHLSDSSHAQRENHKEEDNKKMNNNNNSIPTQSVNITQEAPTELGLEFDKNMNGILSPCSSLSPSPSPSPSPSTPSHPPSLLQQSAAQVVPAAKQVAVASENDNENDNDPPPSISSSSLSTNQWEAPAPEWEHDDQTLYFTNLPSQIAAEELEQMIEPFGEISHCQVFTSPKNQREEASPAIEEDTTLFGMESSESDSSYCFQEWQNQLKLPRCSAYVRMAEKSTCNWVISYFHGNPLDGSSMLVNCGYAKEQNVKSESHATSNTQPSSSTIN